MNIHMIALFALVWGGSWVGLLAIASFRGVTITLNWFSVLVVTMLAFGSAVFFGGAR